MTWNTHYLPPDPTLWQGRREIPPGSCFFQIVQLLNLLDCTSIELLQPTFAIVGFRCDEGIRRNHGRVGAAEGPTALRQALAKLPVQRQGFDFFDVGNIACLNGDLEAAQDALGEIIAMLLQLGIKPIVIGGGHELAWGQFQGIVKAFRHKTVGIINFDSHFDMRPLHNNQGSSGSSFLQIAKACEETGRRFDYNCIGIQHAGNIKQLFETARSYNTHIMLADELHQGLSEKCVDFIDRVVDENEMIYLSICLDAFSSAFAPGVSSPQSLGLSPWHLIPLIRQIAASGKVVSYDIAELSPRYDFDQCTAKLAANLIYEIIHHHTDHPW